MEKIYFCRENGFETKKLYKFFKSIYKEIKIKRKDCLGKCKICKNCPFVLIDGEVVKGTTVDELYYEVNHRISEEWWKFRGNRCSRK
ncbi:hypothetical protein BO219_11975 [Anoxybacillus kestanbolensis]|uniref:DUF1450 domain-containing protein n=1 Tax=Anoxybacillus kestanbolensis TaxID=227476 RepID=A0A1V3FHE0_9BACL|nr:DUF1450 domain-containing protein [Anoxybacillus kestanbolensis]OOE00954.1 hypothetical protein BO219_11975 [Anoxybacillus kestanbolensis]QAV26178.1 DUF1450 domain-containing protein [Neobacillus thermocopriae]